MRFIHSSLLLSSLFILPLVSFAGCATEPLDNVSGSGSTSACPEGYEGCACIVPQVCTDELVCSAGFCIASAVSEGAGGTGSSGGATAGGAMGSGGIPGNTGGAPISVGGSTGGGAPTNTGGVMGVGGEPASGGSPNTGGGNNGTGGETAGSGLTAGACTIGAGEHSGSGSTIAQYQDEAIQRDGANYMMITNGWGQGWVSHSIAWSGTSMTVESFEGSRQSNGAPAGYPTVFCGRYSDKTSAECGLPKSLDSIGQLNTATSWSHEAGDGTYNVAYDIWLGDGSVPQGVFGGGGLESYFMVWLHNPEGEGPAGSTIINDVQVPGIEGNWNIHHGSVNERPIVNYVRPNGEDSYDLAFDIMLFIQDAKNRGLTMPGNDVLSVAIGFEIWQGSVTNLVLNDFCVDVQ